MHLADRSPYDLERLIGRYRSMIDALMEALNSPHVHEPKRKRQAEALAVLEQKLLIAVERLQRVEERKVLHRHSMV